MNKILASLLKRDLTRVVADLEGKLDGLKESSIAVVGGTGFLGTWIALLIDFLNAEHGFNTRLILCSRSASEDFFESLPFRNRLGIQPYRYDVLSPAELPSVDWMIHAAAIPDGRLHSSNPIQTISTLVMGTNNVLAAATRLNELRALLYVSSGLVYGESPSALPTIAEDGFGKLECNSLQAAYAEGKRAAESLCAAYRSQSRLPIVIARPFSLVGPFQPLDLPWAANNFMRDGLNGSTIRIQGDGEAIRSYMHGADFALWSLRRWSPAVMARPTTSAVLTERVFSVSRRRYPSICLTGRRLRSADCKLAVTYERTGFRISAARRMNLDSSAPIRRRRRLKRRFPFIWRTTPDGKPIRSILST